MANDIVYTRIRYAPHVKPQSAVELKAQCLNLFFNQGGRYTLDCAPDTPAPQLPGGVSIGLDAKHLTCLGSTTSRTVALLEPPRNEVWVYPIHKTGYA